MSLEDCEKVYLEEFSKLLTGNKFTYGDSLKYCDRIRTIQDDDKTINYTIQSEFTLNKNRNELKEYFVVLDKIPFMNVTYPLLSKINNNPELNRFYKIIDPNDTILIWGLVNKYGIYHITCQIITSKGFSFSFGILEGDVLEKKNIHYFTTYNSILCTPDILFENKIKKQLEKPNQKHLKLLAISKLNRKHINLLNDTFNKLSGDNLTEYNLYLDFINNNDINFNQQINESNYDMLETLFNHNKFLKNAEFRQYGNSSLNLFKNNNLRIFMRPFYNFTLPNINYCKISKHHNKQINCASFLQSLFDDIITCTGSSIVSIPRFCYQKKTAKRVNCFKVVSNTSKKTQKLI